MNRLLRAMVIPTAAILIATLFAPVDNTGVESAEAVVQEAQVHTLTPYTPPVDWLQKSAELITQLAPSD